LKDAIGKRASDIHVEPYEKDFRVRFRIDGVMYEVMKPPMKLRNAIISRLKIMASLDISERRLPQDGRIKIKLGVGKEMDFRVSVCPTLFGEKVVMRLLDKSRPLFKLEQLGMAPDVAERYAQRLRKMRAKATALVQGHLAKVNTSGSVSAPVGGKPFGARCET
jgi:type IV pilus assembly protein PilB